MILFLVAPSLACPTIATGTPSSLTFDTAQVAIVRQGDRTTFSVSVNPYGDKQSFALVLPVPEILAEDEIRTLDSWIFPALDGFSAPRHVADAGCVTTDGGSDTADSGLDTANPGGDGTVDVEAEYLVGEYQIVILSAEESSGLQAWLDANGYHLPPGAEPRLAEYIEAGSFFLAAKVADEAATASGDPLSPLQISYDSEIFAIPIRLALLNSPGVQDMVIYAITDGGDGRVGIANYAEFEVGDRCIWGDPATDDFNAFYEAEFERAWTAVGAAAWTVEYAGNEFDCNPCSSVTLSHDGTYALPDLGFVGDHEAWHLTRIRMRYTPEQATQDLSLYASGIHEPEVTAYADDYASNYECVEKYCDGNATPGNDDTGDDDTGDDDTGEVDSGDIPDDGEDPWDDDGSDSEDPSAKPADDGCGCGSPTAPAALGLLTATLIRRRRRMMRAC